MLDARQVEVKRPVTSCRAPGIFHLADPQSSQIPLELQADTIGLPLHGDLQHVRSVGLDRANAMPNVCVYRETRNYPRPARNLARTSAVVVRGPSFQRQRAASCQPIGTES